MNLDPVLLTQDAVAAATVANSQVTRWEQLTARAIARGHNEATARVVAFDQLDERIRNAAATETSKTFNDERRRSIGRAVGTQRRIEFVKYWDAALDRRTCPTCAGMNGKWVPADQDFSVGVPGAIHPYCRCVEQLMPRSWVFDDDEQDD